jgi:hypothetical protein
VRTKSEVQSFWFHVDTQIRNQVRVTTKDKVLRQVYFRALIGEQIDNHVENQLRSDLEQL